MKKSQNPQKKHGGFTLIEVLIVLGIIAALSTALVMAVGNTGPKSRAVSDLGSLRSLQSTVDRLVAEYGSLPADFTTNAGNSMPVADRTTLVQILTGTYGGSTPGLATWAAANPVMAQSVAAATLAGQFTAVAQLTPAPRIVILQYRTKSTDNVVNGNQTTSPGFIADSKPFTGDLFSASVNTNWTAQTAWPY
jgi:prepilin-type N-terminal cleavage/methylation domain-containing protein